MELEPTTLGCHQRKHHVRSALTNHYTWLENTCNENLAVCSFDTVPVSSNSVTIEMPTRDTMRYLRWNKNFCFKPLERIANPCCQPEPELDVPFPTLQPRCKPIDDPVQRFDWKAWNSCATHCRLQLNPSQAQSAHHSRNTTGGPWGVQYRMVTSSRSGTEGENMGKQFSSNRLRPQTNSRSAQLVRVTCYQWIISLAFLPGKGAPHLQLQSFGRASSWGWCGHLLHANALNIAWNLC